ncbi:HK97 gp10 family phage protein [Xanthobacter versatilis]|uniref:HK97 gp10 family phage protein n=1 Tax=Xanthobacter autotrophicus (strain ATCC BAA-1158 / Py2) TaxID=78245 RepID=UPI00372B4914
MSLDDFAKRIDRIAVRVEGNVERAVKDCAGAVLRSVVENTPVDTGMARSNWTLELDRAFEGLFPARVPGEKGSTAEENATATIEAGTPTIEAFDIAANREIHITNNAPHIQPLNDGHSRQAPAGFVQMAVMEGLATVRGAKIVED